jgi:hypothetical protein
MRSEGHLRIHGCLRPQALYSQPCHRASISRISCSCTRQHRPSLAATARRFHPRCIAEAEAEADDRGCGE